MATQLTNLSGNTKILVNAIATKQGDLDTAVDNVLYTINNTLEFGSTTTLVDQIFTDSRTIVASGTDSLDLYGGLTNTFGDTISFERVKFIVIKNVSTDSSCILEVGGNSIIGNYVGGFYSTLAINDYVCHGSALGWHITDSTHDSITISNDSSTEDAKYEIVIIGTQA